MDVWTTIDIGGRITRTQLRQLFEVLKNEFVGGAAEDLPDDVENRAGGRPHGHACS